MAVAMVPWLAAAATAEWTTTAELPCGRMPTWAEVEAAVVGRW